jgi:lipopolysaccharide/colanic/teichoic acid biosynthesis glycosyltransferase
VTPICLEEVRSVERPRQITRRAVPRHVFTRAERILAALALVILAPILIVIAITILVLSRRNPLIRHNRVGWRGRPLAMLKFRTMWDPAKVPLISTKGRRFAIESVSGYVPISKLVVDDRVKSRFAAFCRRHSLDELPQLYHVVRGEMSLVGPRPITREEMHDYYGASSDEILSVRPGLTGLWQVRGRSRLSYERRRRLDLLLVRRASPDLYLAILLRSIPGILTGRDAC